MGYTLRRCPDLVSRTASGRLQFPHWGFQIVPKPKPLLRKLLGKGKGKLLGKGKGKAHREFAQRKGKARDENGQFKKGKVKGKVKGKGKGCRKGKKIKAKKGKASKKGKATVSVSQGKDNSKVWKDNSKEQNERMSPAQADSVPHADTAMGYSSIMKWLSGTYAWSFLALSAAWSLLVTVLAAVHFLCRVRQSNTDVLVVQSIPLAENSVQIASVFLGSDTTSKDQL